MQIEKANLAELDWALANMDTGGKGKKHNKPTNELVHADTKIKEDVRWLCVGTPRISNLFWLQGMNFRASGRSFSTMVCSHACSLYLLLSLTR